jgi:RimJ/RimL family protein N-acetyltransferase
MTTIRQSCVIRVATVDDRWAVRKLFSELHELNAKYDPRFALSDGWERHLDTHLAREWSGATSLTLLAWQEDQPVGLLMLNGYTDSPLFRYRQWAEILALYIDPDIRGGLLAYRFVKAAKRWARENDFDRIQLFVTTSNERARRFYAKAGFRSVQEVWRLELDPPESVARHAPPNGNGYGPSRDPLSSRPHLMDNDDEDKT